MSSFAASETATHKDTHTPIGLKLMVCCGLDQSQRELRKSPSPLFPRIHQVQLSFLYQMPMMLQLLLYSYNKRNSTKIPRPVYVKLLFSAPSFESNTFWSWQPQSQFPPSHFASVKVLTSSSFLHDTTLLAALPKDHLNVLILAFPLFCCRGYVLKQFSAC